MSEPETRARDGFRLVARVTGRPFLPQSLAQEQKAAVSHSARSIQTAQPAPTAVREKQMK